MKEIKNKQGLTSDKKEILKNLMGSITSKTDFNEVLNEYKYGVFSAKGTPRVYKNPNNIVCNRVYNEVDLNGNTYIINNGIKFSNDIYNAIGNKDVIISYGHNLSSGQDDIVIIFKECEINE